MRLRNPQFFSRYEFFMLDPHGSEVRIPREGFAQNISQLTELAWSQMGSFDAATQNQYTELLRQEAEKNGLSPKAYLRQVIEHQICLRSAKDACWNDGIGDTVHTFFKKIDGWIDNSKYNLVKKIGKAVTMAATYVATGTSQKSFGSCSKCGGTKSYDANKSSLGRAGKVNQFFK